MPTDARATAETERPAPPEDGHQLLIHHSTRPPRWFARGLAMAVVAVFLGLFAWYALGALKSLGVTLLISFFISLALEPMTVWLVRHGWRRRVAALTTLIGSLVVIVILLFLFGSLFVSQLTDLVENIPEVYADLTDWLSIQFDIHLPASDVLLTQAVQNYGQDFATQAIGIGTSVISVVFNSFTVMTVTYYLVAAGPKFRAAVCRWFTPNRQHEVLLMWEITQVKVSDFINTRIVLAALNAFFTFVFLTIVHTPYSVPLALFCGVVSQFIPTIGTYIGGALPVIVALTLQGPLQALAVLAFIIVYQQVENLFFAPKVSAKALEMNPAISFVVVLAFGAVFGPLGAFLGLPIAATIQAIANTYVHHHELIESDMLHDPDSWRQVRNEDEATGRRSRFGRQQAKRPPAPAAADGAPTEARPKLPKEVSGE